MVLVGARCENNDSSASILENFGRDMHNVGIRWSLEGHGVDRIEITVRSPGRYEPYSRYQAHQGQRLALGSRHGHALMSGFISEVRPDGPNWTTYVAKGPKWRLKDALINDVYDNTDTVSDTITSILTGGAVSIVGDTSNISSNSTTLNGWQPAQPSGSYPITLLDQLLDMSDSSYNIYDLWFRDQAMTHGPKLRQYAAYYFPRTTAGTADWQVSRKDLTNIRIARDINDLATSVTVHYSTVTATANASSSGSTFVTASGSFLSDGISEGDQVTNITDGCRGQIASVVSDTSFTARGLAGGVSNDFANGDVVSITMRNGKKTSTTATTTSDYGSREIIEERPFLSSTQANQLAEMILEADARPSLSFNIGSRWARNSVGIELPLWEMISRGGGYIKIRDLFPGVGLSNTTRDALTTFRITALDYNHTSRMMRVTVDTLDSKLDSVLARSNILAGPIVWRGR